MNVLLVAHEFFLDGAQHHGGIATYVKNLSLILSSQGCKVTVVTLSDMHNDRICWKGIAVERVKVPRWAYQLRRLLKCKAGEYIIGAILIRRRINQIMRQQKPDIIHYANFKSVGLFRRKDVPCVIRMSSDNVLWRETYKTHYKFEEAFNKVSWDDRLELLTVKRADGVFAPSKLVAEITSKRTNREVKVIESPAPFPTGDIAKGRNLMEGKQYFLYYGSLSRMKGIHTIGDILLDVLAAYPEIYFVFIGHDYNLRFENYKISCTDFLKKQAGIYADRVIIENYLEPELLYPIIENAFCCIFPSRIDNLPNTCLEAMAFKRPIIATHGASFEQLITDGHSGFLTGIDDSQSLLKAIHRMIALSPEERTLMGNNAYLRSLECSGDAVYGQVMNFYEEVISQYETKRSAAIS